MTDSFAGQAGVYRYHLLRGAVERFSKSVAELNESQLADADSQATRTYALESLVLSSREAQSVAVSPGEVDAAVASIASRYADRNEFLSDLTGNGLTEDVLREALRRELVFSGVLDRVAADRPPIGRQEARHYYRCEADRFVVPERRRVRQILITVNEDIADNRRDVARLRIETIAAELGRYPDRFSDSARRYSECPSAFHEGRLGDVQRGDLYPSLDATLFSMVEGSVSSPIETKIGFHVLWLEKVLAARTLPFAEVESRITRVLDERNKRRCQNTFLAELREARRRTAP